MGQSEPWLYTDRGVIVVVIARAGYIPYVIQRTHTVPFSTDVSQGLLVQPDISGRTWLI